jgi:hypothetical protein
MYHLGKKEKRKKALTGPSLWTGQLLAQVLPLLGYPFSTLPFFGTRDKGKP